MLLPVILIASVGVAVVNSGLIPSDIEICHKSDPKFAECYGNSLMKAIRKFAPGYPPLGINRIEPLYIDGFDVNATHTDTISLQQHYENINVYGTTTAKIANMTISIEENNCFWAFNALTPELRMESDYRINGKMLLFPINGHGKCTNTLTNVNGFYSVKCEFYKKINQKTYLRITDFIFKMDPERIHFDFQNVNDKQQLTKEVMQTINENAQSVFKDVKSGFEQFFANLYKYGSNDVFTRIPIDELFPQ